MVFRLWVVLISYVLDVYSLYLLVWIIENSLDFYLNIGFLIYFRFWDGKVNFWFLFYLYECRIVSFGVILISV